MQPLFHIGHIKTASSWLQRRVFAHSEGGFLIPWEDARARLVASFVVPDGYDFDVNEARGRLDQGISDAIAAGAVPVLSDETLLGDPLSRRYDGARVAQRIHTAYPDARIVIGVREQCSMAISAYHQFLRECGRLPIRSFIGTGHEPLSFTSILREEWMCWDRAVQRYHELFGPERVLVLPLELLARDQDAYLQRLYEFSGVDRRPAVSRDKANPRFSATALELERWFNHFIKLDPTQPRRSFGFRAVNRFVRTFDRCTPRFIKRRADQKMRRLVEQRYAGCFEQSNQRLGELTGLDLAALGYQVPKTG